STDRSGVRRSLRSRSSMLARLAVASGRIKVDSVSVALEDDGRGEPVVLVHGLSSDRRAAAARVHALRDRFRLLAADLPGFGQSDKPRSYLYSPDGLGAFVVRLARELELSRYAVVGFGTGRAVAARAQRRDSDRIVLAAALDEPVSAPALVRTLFHFRSSYA